MVRPFREQIDESILDRAAALFARRGYAQTSLQAVADDIGMSKAGLLHHFPSKEALRSAATTRAHELQVEALEQVRDLAPGPARDRLALETLLDQALARPGLVAFSLAGVVSPSGPGGAVLDAGNEQMLVLETFAVDADRDPERLIRVLGALGALSLLTVVVTQAGRATAWRRHVLETCYAALGHG